MKVKMAIRPRSRSGFGGGDDNYAPQAPRRVLLVIVEYGNYTGREKREERWMMQGVDVGVFDAVLDIHSGHRSTI